MRAALFVTCLVDTLVPSVGRATVELLERLDVQVSFPRSQTCCGQLHYNAGYPEVAASLARRFVEVFAGEEVIVSPSASCAAHVRAHVPELATDENGVCARTFELSELLVDRLGERGCIEPAGGPGQRIWCTHDDLLRWRASAGGDAGTVAPSTDGTECKP